MADFSRRDLFAPGPGEIRYISEAEKVFRGRDVLRQAGVLPAEVSPGEWAFAVFDALSHGWFSAPDNRRRLMEALAHAWVITSIPTLHVPEEAWRAAFDDAAPAAADLDVALPVNVRHIEVFRGCPADRRDGLSWTTDRNTAAWFACRASKVGVIGEVYRAVAPRDAVLVDLRRFSGGESEVLVRTELVRDVNRVEMDFDKALRNWYRKALRIASEARAQGLACDDPEPPDLDGRVGDEHLPSQSIDPSSPRYVPPPWTPDGIDWPSPSQARVVQMGEQLMADFPFQVTDQAAFETYMRQAQER
jgi:hypothetical protein